MQVKLVEDTGNVTIEKDGEGFVICIDSRVRVNVTKPELKLMHALIGALLTEKTGSDKGALKKLVMETLSTNKARFQDVLRKMKAEDTAFVVWYCGDVRTTQEILKNMSKRAADDVQDTVRETIERRIRKERSEGNQSFEKEMDDYGRCTVMNMLKQVLDSDNLPI